LATKVVVSKYFYGEQNTPERETSVRQLIHRVCRTIADWGVKDGYFTKADGECFTTELTWLCVNQYGAFNSPVWFNVGLFHQYGVGKNSARGNWHYDPATRQARRAARNMSVRRQRLFHPIGGRQHGVDHAVGPQRRRCCSSTARGRGRI
jgi:ribonucleoside-diphosphate reductase alpha chain